MNGYECPNCGFLIPITSKQQRRDCPSCKMPESQQLRMMTRANLKAAGLQT